MKKLILALGIVVGLLLLSYVIFHKRISENANQSGIEQYTAEHYTEAAKSFRKAVKYDKGNLPAKINLVRTLLVLEEYSNAREILENIIEKFPENAETLALSGQLHTLESKFEEAVELLNKAIQMQNDLAFAYYYRGIARANLNDLEGAAADYKKAQEIDEGNIEALEQRATILSKLMDYDEAISNYNMLIEADPSNITAFLNRGNFKMEIDDYPGAIEDFTSVLSLDEKQAEAYFNRGKSYAKHNDFANAIADFNSSIELNYKVAGANFNAGLAYLKLNQPVEAKKYLLNTVKLDNNSENTGKAYLMLGVMEMMQSRNQAAIDYYNSSLEIEAENADVLFNRAIAYGNLKMHQQALADLNSCVNLGMKTADVYYAMGIQKISMNDFSEGCKNLKTAEEMGHANAGELIKQYCG